MTQTDLETGVVEGVEGQWAWVRTVRKEACEHCGAQGQCLFGEGGKTMRVRALNRASASVGDEVELFLSPASRFKSVLVVFAIPVAGLMAGLFLGAPRLSAWGMPDETAQIIMTLLGLGLGLGLVPVLGRRMNRGDGLTPVVSRIRRAPGK